MTVFHPDFIKDDSSTINYKQQLKCELGFRKKLGIPPVKQWMKIIMFVISLMVDKV